MTTARAARAWPPVPPPPADEGPTVRPGAAGLCAGETVPPTYSNASSGWSTLRRCVRSGRLLRVGYDTYLEPHDADAPIWERRRTEVLARCATLQRRAGDSFVSSHTTAALIHGLWVPSSTTLHVTQPHARPSTPGRDDPVIRHRRRLEAGEIVQVAGLRVTSLERTVIDCAALLPADWALAVTDSALRMATRADRRRPDGARKHATNLLEQWRQRLEQRGPRPGRRRARAVLAVGDPLAESPGESRTRAALLAPGLPPPTLQIPLRVGESQFWADFGWLITPGRYLLGEFDGAIKYRLDGLTGPALAGRLAKEKRREDGIRRLGHDVERVVDADLATARGRAALAQRMRAKLPEALLEGCAPRPELALAPGRP